MEELNIIAENDNEINNQLLLYGENCQKNFKKYYILNKAWFDKYKISLKIQINNNLFMNIQDTFPAVNQRILKIKQTKEYSYPANFIIINDKYISIFNKIKFMIRIY